MTVSFDCSRDESALIRAIADRADREIFGPFKIPQSRIDTEMDVTACHANGRPLRLGELLAAPDFDFCHDVTGIRRHLNRETGALENCFLPRYAK